MEEKEPAMRFTSGEMPVFNRKGQRVGELTKWAITKTRTFRINEVEDFSFVVPQRDEQGDDVLTIAVNQLLALDNIVYIENEISTFPGWAGYISQVTYENGGAWVDVVGAFGLLDNLDTTLIKQTGGESATIAERLVNAANAKKGAHGVAPGDLQIGFVRDSSSLNYGTFSYEGNVMQGLQRLADDTLSEFKVVSTISGDGESISVDLHWANRFVSDHTGAPTFMDGPNGNLEPGGKALYSGLETINHARLKGASTTIADYVAYSAVKGVIKEITPEIEYTQEGSDNLRRREDLSLTVNFSYSEDVQRQFANEIQSRYIQFYKQFLYAMHNRQGKPFLDGYDWEGPAAPNTEKVLNATSYKTINKLGLIGSAAVVVVAADDVTIDTGSMIDGWVYDTSISVNHTTGIAISQADTSDHIIASSWDNSLTLYTPATTSVTGTVDAAYTTTMFKVGSAGDVLVGVATDTADPETVWCLFNNGSDTSVKWYSVDSGEIIGSWTITNLTANDMQVDVSNGLVYLVGSTFQTVLVRDLSNGMLIDPDPSFDSGFTTTVAGVSNSGGICYVIDTGGHVRMLYLTTGGLAGTFDTGQNTNGILVDPENKRIYLVNSDGSISVYHANIAMATVDPPSGAVSAPDFGEVLKGQFVHIVMVNDHAYPAKSTSTTNGTYTVKSGDTLWAIAKHYYGSGTSWRTIYNANKAEIERIAKAHRFSSSDHGHWIFPGEVLVIPGVGGKTTPAPPTSGSHTRYMMCYTKADWVTRHEGDPIDGTIPTIKEWTLNGDQVVGTIMSDKCSIHDPAVVIYGEEGRVNDWDPSRDGYGEFLDHKLYRTKSGHQRDEGPGWYPREWDVVDTAWEITPSSIWEKPEDIWPEGQAYLAEMLKRRNAEVSVQSFQVANVDNVWSQIELGGVYTLSLSLQGPVPHGIVLDIRVVGFAPSELTGTCEISAEVYIP